MAPFDGGSSDRAKMPGQLSGETTTVVARSPYHRPPARHPDRPVGLVSVDEVATSVAEGLTDAEIAVALHASHSTVTFRLASVLNHDRSGNRVEIVIWAYGTRRAGRQVPTATGCLPCVGSEGACVPDRR